jgi:hypothetical protein
LRPTLERLEDLTLLTSYTAATVSDLIADISASNQQGGTNTIALVAGNAFLLTAVDNTTDGATGLPVIAVHDNLTIVGNGDTIGRSTAAGTPAFRLLDVAAGASLTLQDLTLQGGLATGAGIAAEGGAVFSQGTLDLNGVTVQDNEALGAPGATGSMGNGHNGGNGGNASGGGLYVAGGSVTLTGSTLSADTAQGGQGGRGEPTATIGHGGQVPGNGGNGGNASGGGLYVAGGSVTLTSVTLSADTAQGGQGGWGPVHRHGGNGGNGFGGGLYAGGGTVALSQDTVTGNAAQGGAGGSGRHSGTAGLGEGGGLFIDPAAVVSLDAFTQANVTGNTASTKDPNIHGPWRHS